MVPAESAAWEAFPGSRLEAEPGSDAHTHTHTQEHCTITETQHHGSCPTPSYPARAATTSSRPGRGRDKAGDRQTWNDPVGCCVKREEFWA